MFNSMKEDIDRLQKRDKGDMVFGTISDTWPLYVNLNAQPGDHPLKQCILKHVVSNLVRKASKRNNNLEVAFQIMLTLDSIGRGGEVKFQNIEKWDFDHFTRLLDTPWTEPKTLDYYAMPRIPDDHYWYFCFYWMLRAYAMCERGHHV